MTELSLTLGTRWEAAATRQAGTSGRAAATAWRAGTSGRAGRAAWQLSEEVVELAR
jgi:hypothetical protein